MFVSLSAVYPERERPCSGCSGGQDAAVQVSGPPPLQLYVLPQHRCGCRRRRTGDGPGAAEGAATGAAAGPGPGPLRGACVWLVQAALCLAGLAFLILTIALLGAAAFHATEGPHEDLQVRELNKTQGDLVIQLATDLRVVAPNDSVWRSVIEKSVEQHEQMVLRAAAAGYGEGGAGEGGARIWTYPGGLLFAASLLTTLGFGAPVPRTPLGRLAAVVLAVVGIPLNVVLALQLGRLLSTRLLPVLSPAKASKAAKQAAVAGHASPPDKRRGPGGGCTTCPSCWAAPGSRGALDRGEASFRWAPLLVPVGSLLAYYILGTLVFGPVLGLPFAEWMLFPLSLTAAGGVARVPGWVRVAYAAYLEGGVLLAAVAVALLQAPATTATTDLAMRLGILNLDDYYAAS